MQRREVIEKYYAAIPQEKRAYVCVKCGACEEKCPQKLPIRGLLSRSQWILRLNNGVLKTPPAPHLFSSQ